MDLKKEAEKEFNSMNIIMKRVRARPFIHQLCILICDIKQQIKH